MGVTRLLIAGLVWLGCTAEACACTPLPVFTFPAVLLGWFAWLCLLVCFNQRAFANDPMNKYWFFGVPLALIPFSTPVYLVILFPITLPLVILYAAFPVHLVIEFCRACFGHIHDRAERTPRMILFGLPLALIVIGGVIIKWWVYSEYGGLRGFIWNLSGTLRIYAFFLLIGIGLLGLRLGPRVKAADASRTPTGE